MSVTVLDPIHELNALQRALEASAQLVREGNAVDLHGLDGQVEILCNHIVTTEGPLRLQLLPKLEEILSVLDWLESELRQHSPVAAQEAQQRLKAKAAYGMPAPELFKEH